MQYVVNEYSVEFRTKLGQEWREDDYKKAFEELTSIDPYQVATFNKYEDAEKYLESCNNNWCKEKVSTGYVMEGNIYSIEEYDEGGGVLFNICKVKYV